MSNQQEAPVRTGTFEDLVQRNVESIARIEKATQDSRTKADVLADAIAGFCGSTLFVYVHCIWFGLWLGWNSLGVVSKGLHFDPPPFGVLTLIVSLEAIFLSTFILISQNRQQRTADQRNHLDLQINLLAEQESSQMLAMMKQVMDHLGISPTQPKEVEALEKPTDPARVVDKLNENLPDQGSQP